MYTNTSAYLQLGGTISAAQIGEGQNWQDFVSPGNCVSLVSQINDAKTMNLSNGMYAFRQPTEVEDFDFKAPLDVSLTSGQIEDVDDDMDETSGFIVMALTCPDPAGCSGYVTLRGNFEYKTKDTWRDVRAPELTHDVWDEALQRMGSVDQFHENPLHMDDIWKAIKSGVGAVSNVASTVMSIAKPIYEVAQFAGKIL
jgi:hypothetical protein